MQFTEIVMSDPKHLPTMEEVEWSRKRLAELHKLFPNHNHKERMKMVANELQQRRKKYGK